MDKWKKKRIIRTYGKICLRCGSKEKLTVDHIKPISKGGTDDFHNLQPLCESCNQWKADREIDFRTIPIDETIFFDETRKFDLEEFAKLAKRQRYLRDRNANQ